MLPLLVLVLLLLLLLLLLLVLLLLLLLAHHDTAPLLLNSIPELKHIHRQLPNMQHLLHLLLCNGSRQQTTIAQNC
jgi:hypothetical protein